ncbi:hypothetical protein ABW19_dt0206998 [Dactylella cylindrospora]|nr:hypothetical protein ABW19_dt0206998 [Dactylella cylindrospora]
MMQICQSISGYRYLRRLVLSGIYSICPRTTKTGSFPSLAFGETLRDLVLDRCDGIRSTLAIILANCTKIRRFKVIQEDIREAREILSFVKALSPLEELYIYCYDASHRRSDGSEHLSILPHPNLLRSHEKSLKNLSLHILWEDMSGYPGTTDLAATLGIVNFMPNLTQLSFVVNIDDYDNLRIPCIDMELYPKLKLIAIEIDAIDCREREYEEKVWRFCQNIGKQSSTIPSLSLLLSSTDHGFETASIAWAINWHKSVYGLGHLPSLELIPNHLVIIEAMGFNLQNCLSQRTRFQEGSLGGPLGW